MRVLRACIVDDERLARQRLARLLLQEPGVDIVAQCKNVREAREILAGAAPDVIFADVQMPRESGFDLVGALEGPARPAIIFVTAYERYAVQAFDVMACDYLLKPVVDTRLRVALRRAREFLEPQPSAAGASEASGEPRGDAILVKVDDKIVRVRVDAIDWIEAAGNYVHVHAGSQSFLVRETIAAFEARLPPGSFARIHRTAIASLDRIVEFEPTLSGDFVVTLRGGQKLRMSRSYRGRIRDLFGRTI